MLETHLFAKKLFLLLTCLIFHIFQIIACGSTFAMAGVQSKPEKEAINKVYFWGKRPSRRTRTTSTSDPSKSLNKSSGLSKSMKTSVVESGFEEIITGSISDGEGLK